MDDRKLHVMLTTLRLGSLGKAALELNCSQPAVTQAINSMEGELGCKLFTRNHTGVQLTPAGETLLPLIVDADASHRRLLEQAKAISQGGVIPIRLAAFASFLHSWLPNAIKDYQKDHPEVTFDIRVASEKIHDWLQLGEVDVALADAPMCKGFRWHPLMDDQYVVVLHQSMISDNVESIPQRELSHYPFITAPMEEANVQLNPRPTRCLSVNSEDNSALLSMVAQGLGVTVLPRLCLQSLPPSVRTLELSPPIKRVLGIALSNAPNKSVRDFAAFLRKRFPYDTPHVGKAPHLPFSF